MRKKKKILTAFFLLLFSCSFVYLVCHVLDYYHSASRIAELEQLLEEQTAVPESITTPSESTTKESSDSIDPVMLPEFEALYQQNPDIIGWLKIEGTPISYPVMYTPQDPQFYLNHNFDRKDSKSGTPFLDSRCNITEPTDNWIIYGHNMKNGSMFRALINYKDEAYYKEHPVIRFDTLYEQGEYEIIAVFLSKVYRKDDDVFKYYQFVNAETKTEFDLFIQNIKELSLYDTGSSAQYGDQLLTLSTCEYSIENGRLVVVARNT